MIWRSVTYGKKSKIPLVEKADDVVAREFHRQKVLKLKDLHVLHLLGVVLIDEEYDLASIHNLAFFFHLSLP